MQQSPKHFLDMLKSIGNNSSPRVERAQNKQQILIEANEETARQLEEVKKELNDHNVQHKEGIYWLRLQLKATRKEKDAAEKRMIKLQNDLRSITKKCDDLKPCKDDSINNSHSDERDVLIAQLRKRLGRYESSFGVMENQISILQSSSSVVINGLKEEIANLMEERTKAELDLLNRLSDLDNIFRRKQLEFALEIEKKNETIESLRRGQQVSLCTGDITASGSSDISGCGVSLKDNAESNFDETSVRQLQEDRTELKRKLELAMRELEDLRRTSEYDGESKSLALLWKERHEIESSVCSIKEVVDTTYASISNIKDLIDGLVANGNHQIGKQKKTMLTMLEYASLVHGQVKLSIALVEEKLKNSFEKAKINITDNRGKLLTHSCNQEVIESMEEVRDQALVELADVGAKFLDLLKDLEERAKLEKKQLEALLQQKTGEVFEATARIKEYHHRSSACDEHESVDSVPVNGSQSSKQFTDDTVMISRDVLHRLETELVQFAERMHSKNKKINSLKAELLKQKLRGREKEGVIMGWEDDPAFDVGDDIEEEICTIKYDDVHERVKPMESIIVKLDTNGPRDLSPLRHRRVLSSDEFPFDIMPPNITLKSKATKRRNGMPDESLRGGTDPISSPKPMLPRHGNASITPSSDVKEGIALSPNRKPISDSPKIESQPQSRGYIPTSLFAAQL